jgi:hypothetical protein
MRRALLLSLFMFSLGGCLGVATPAEEEANAIGHDDEGPEHNPGQPCVLCHSGSIFVGGTVYDEQTDPDMNGLEGVTVTITDANGDPFVAFTNPAGNFYFSEGGFDDATQLDFTPVFPLHARIEMGGVEQEMVTPIQRERSCSACHSGDPDVDSVGRIYLVDPP